MSSVTHQTIKLSKGKHSSPEGGACVMELASMLAGEPFTDHPESVCPAIGSFLRAYNDAIDDHRRQDLYAYAARVVGSRSSYEIECARTDRLAEWAAQTQSHRPTRRLLPARLRLVSLHRRPIDALGTDGVRAIREHTDQTHAAALALVDQLLAIEVPQRDGASDAPTECATTEERPLTRAADGPTRPDVAPADATLGTP